MAITQRKTQVTKASADDVAARDAPPLSNSSSSSDLALSDKELTTTSSEAATKNLRSKGKTLEERNAIPTSLYVSSGIILGIQYFSGMWSLSTLESYKESVGTAVLALSGWLQYLQNTVQNVISGDASSMEPFEYLKTALIVGTCVLLFGVFFVAPFRAGLWTGRKARRHKFHRYQGLNFLIHYALALAEFFGNYDQAKTSYLCHLVGIFGLLQGWSAYFSFKVLPELYDPGYYSDKAVLSRSFVHENIFFTFMAVCGSAYYNEVNRAVLRSSLPGRMLELVFVFFPYVLVRPLFPLTSFSNAGQTHKGRTERNQRFYEIGTLMVKFFYLWAKYFLGFCLNFCIFLDVVRPEHWKYIHGMLLLNTGTVSLAVFLHTLRFKKVLPAKFTFSLYLVQIYLSFLAVPMICSIFLAHPKLCSLVVAGIFINMTRVRKLHAVWCGCAAILLHNRSIDW